MAKRFDDDGEALAFLEAAGFKVLHNGLIRAPSKDHSETPDEAAALDYLFTEWDYADEPRDQWQAS